MIYAKDSHESARPANATAMIGAQELHGEIRDPSTRNVWQSLGPITREDYQELSLEPGWLRVGIGIGAMDEHWFARSHGAAKDGPMELFGGPMVTIYSDGDQIARNAEQRFIEEVPLCKGQPHVILEGGNHFLQEDIPGAFLEAFIPWLESTPSRR